MMLPQIYPGDDLGLRIGILFVVLAERMFDGKRGVYLRGRSFALNLRVHERNEAALIISLCKQHTTSTDFIDRQTCPGIPSVPTLDLNIDIFHWYAKQKKTIRSKKAGPGWISSVRKGALYTHSSI